MHFVPCPLHLALHFELSIPTKNKDIALQIRSGLSSSSYPFQKLRERSLGLAYEGIGASSVKSKIIMLPVVQFLL